MLSCIISTRYTDFLISNQLSLFHAQKEVVQKGQLYLGPFETCSTYMKIPNIPFMRLRELPIQNHCHKVWTHQNNYYSILINVNANYLPDQSVCSVLYNEICLYDTVKCSISHRSVMVKDVLFPVRQHWGSVREPSCSRHSVEQKLLSESYLPVHCLAFFDFKPSITDTRNVQWAWDGLQWTDWTFHWDQDLRVHSSWSYTFI
jgi:hypothetical protein